MTQTLYRGAALLALFSVLAFAVPVLADVERVGGDWQLSAPASLDFTCGGGTYAHTLLTVAQDQDGNLTGTGHYNPNNAYTWDMTGTVSGTDVSMQIVYTGLSAGSVYNLVGTIAPDGSILGTSDSNCQTFEMPAGTASQSDLNHGQYVKSQDDKKAAAQDRTGMPVQSKGHTN